MKKSEREGERKHLLFPREENTDERRSEGKDEQDTKKGQTSVRNIRVHLSLYITCNKL